MEVAVRVVVRVRGHHQVGEILTVGQPRRRLVQAGKVVVAEDVAVHHQEERVAEQRQCAADAAGGLQRLGFGRVADRHAEQLAVAERAFDHLAEVGVVDHQFGEAGGAQPFDVPDDQRLAAGRQQRLGVGVGQRAHAFAAPGGQDHRAHRHQKV